MNNIPTNFQTMSIYSCISDHHRPFHYIRLDQISSNLFGLNTKKLGLVIYTFDHEDLDMEDLSIEEQQADINYTASFRSTYSDESYYELFQLCEYRCEYRNDMMHIGELHISEFDNIICWLRNKYENIFAAKIQKLWKQYNFCRNLKVGLAKMQMHRELVFFPGVGSAYRECEFRFYDLAVGR
jgi:hypothetical protein